MTAGKCIFCRQDFKNLEVHTRHCKAKPQSSGIGNPNLSNNTPPNINAPDKTNAQKIASHELPPKIPKLRSYGIVIAICALILMALYVWTKSRILLYPAIVLFVFAVIFIIISFIIKPKVQSKTKRIVPMEEILEALPEWSIKENKPWFVPKDKRQRMIQFVGVSRIKRPVCAWVMWNGVYISIGDVAGEERLYEPPHDIRGDIFFYDLDRKIPLLDNIKPDDRESHESLRMGQVRNISFTLAVLSGANKLMNNIGNVQILLLVSILIGIIDGILIYSMTKDIGAFVNRANPMLDNATAYFASHP